MIALLKGRNKRRVEKTRLDWKQLREVKMCLRGETELLEVEKKTSDLFINSPLIALLKDRQIKKSREERRKYEAEGEETNIEK